MLKLYQQPLVLNRRCSPHHSEMKQNDVVFRLGRQIRALRKKNSLTQEQLAGRSGISLKYVQKLEGKDPQNPSLVVLRKIADGFEIPLWKLLKFDT